MLDRVVLHVDLDCFYAAVEQVRLGIPPEVPLAVQQWEGLIAVNYAARAAGITRHMRVHEAKRKCPELQCVHVEVIGGGMSGGGSSAREQGKASLERYRQASAAVLPIFQRFSPLCERASIDEAYLDISAAVEELLRRHEKSAMSGDTWDGGGETNADEAAADYDADPLRWALARKDIVVLDGPLLPTNPGDNRLLAGAAIAARMRDAVKAELGYTCSSGVATNKLIAKIGSAMNKPNKQTVVPHRAVAGLMQTIPLTKIKNLGGKLGQELSGPLGCKTAGDVQQISAKTLTAKFGERMGTWVFRAVRGIHDEPVQVRQISKSMLAAKTFGSTSDTAALQRWLHILAMELAQRMTIDIHCNRRRARTLQLYYTGTSEHSKSCPMPPNIKNILQASLNQPPPVPAISPPQSPQRATQAPLHAADEKLEEDAAAASKPEEDGPAEGLDEEVERAEGEQNSEGLERQGGRTGEQRESPLSQALFAAGWALFEKAEGNKPCSRLALAAGDFVDLPADGVQSITRFFKAGASDPSTTQLQWAPAEPAAQKAPSPSPSNLLKYFSSQPQDRAAETRVSLQADAACPSSTLDRSKRDNISPLRSLEVKKLRAEKTDSSAPSPVPWAFSDSKAQGGSGLAARQMGLDREVHADEVREKEQVAHDKEVPCAAGTVKDPGISVAFDPTTADERVAVNEDCEVRESNKSARPGSGEAVSGDLEGVDIEQQKRLLAHYERQNVRPFNSRPKGQEGRHGSLRGPPSRGRPSKGSKRYEKESGQKTLSSFLSDSSKAKNHK